MDTKFCRDCGSHRPITEFTRNRNSRDGFAFYCRDHARKRHEVSRDRRNGTPKRRYPRGLDIPEGHKWCRECNQVLPFSEFGNNAASRTGRTSYCKPCHNAAGRRAKELAGGERTYHLRRRYGITAHEADAMLATQGGLCAICRAAPAEHVDHDHATGAVRALLCFNCNGGLGQFKDDPFLLHLAAFYVEHHNSRQALAVLQDVGAGGPEGASRPGEPPVGSQRRPGTHATSARGTGRTSSGRRRQRAGEADE
jgi:hypothetical protein